MQDHNENDLYELVKQGLNDIGYAGKFVQENYEFADFLGPEYSVGRIPLAAFAQDPPSYRNACFGVVIANGVSGHSSINRFRSLGAPQIFEICDGHLYRWKMTFQGDPVLLEQATAVDIPVLFQKNREDWSPVRILKAKASGGEESNQLDFFDIGLLPLLEREVREKLDQLLNETISLTIEEFQRQSPFTDECYPPLFRLLFRLISAKVLSDRGHPGEWLQDDPRTTLKVVHDFYFKDESPELILENFRTQIVAWERIRKAFHFQNLSVDSLAYVYENTLVAPETRKLYGIHSTPPAVAEYVIRQLPLADLEQNHRRIFEPFAGHAVFLVAAMQRLRELLPQEMTSQQRHLYFVKMLSGIEIDDFAREVARLSLILADYPNPDGWQLHKEDAFNSGSFERELRKANVVLCNPPFEDFSTQERIKLRELHSVHKPAAILKRVLQQPPKMLGFVLPRIFSTGRGYKQLRSLIGKTYSTVELLALPDKVFQHSEAETVLLLASKKGGRTFFVRNGEVYQKDLKSFYRTHRPSYTSERTLEFPTWSFGENLWLPPLQDVWKASSRMNRLGELADIHRGIEYNLPIRQNMQTLVSDESREGFVRGLHVVKNVVEPFRILKTIFLNLSSELMRGSAHTLAWNMPKLIVNASRITRGSWKIAASSDDTGLVCFRNFHGIWPNNNMSLEVLAAIINSPVANAFISTRDDQRSIRIQTLRRIPIPNIHPEQEREISSLVHEYKEVRGQWLFGLIPHKLAHSKCKKLLQLIDAEVLKAYDLPPRIERSLLNYFSGHARPGPVEFMQYFPDSFKPSLPWHRFISSDLEEATAAATLARLITIDDPLISEAMKNLHQDLSG